MIAPVINFPARVTLRLPTSHEFLTLYPCGSEIAVDGVNHDRGFSWSVGSFATWPEAMTAAWQHHQAEVLACSASL